MEQKIKEVNDYFKQKIVAGQYEVGKIDKWTVQLIIDKQYNFIIWISNKASGIETYNNSFDKSFMQLEFSKAEKKAILDDLNKVYLSERKKLINQEIKELEDEL